MARHFANIVRSIRAQLPVWARRRIAARRLRLKYERDVYRKFNAYCRANNLIPFCEDDWKIYYYDRDTQVSGSLLERHVP